MTPANHSLLLLQDADKISESLSGKMPEPVLLFYDTEYFHLPSIEKDCPESSLILANAGIFGEGV